MTLNQQLKALILIPFADINKIFNRKELGEIYSSVASDRLQIRPLIEALDSLGYKITAASLNTTFQIREFQNLKGFDLCIVSKMRCHRSEDENQFTQFHTCCVLQQKRLGAKLLTIYSDHVANIESLDGELYKNLLYLSDHIVTPSGRLNELVNGIMPTAINISTIEDPCQLERKNFTSLSDDEIIRILWFGNFGNLHYLEKILKNIMARSIQKKRFELTILTSRPGLKSIINKFKPENIPRNWSFRLALWDINNQPRQLERELSRAHITLLPSDPLDAKKNGASHNRLVDSIQAGCIAIASPIDSYLELSKICLISEDFGSSLLYAVENYSQLQNEYAKIRNLELERFEPSLNIKKWESAIKQAMYKCTK